MYRNVSDFFSCIFTDFFFLSLCEIFSVFNIIRSGHLTKVIFSLPFRFQFLFISFSSLTYVERTSSTMLNIKVVFFGHAMWLVRSSFPHQGLNTCPCQAVKVQSLNRWTTRESLFFFFFSSVFIPILEDKLSVFFTFEHDIIWVFPRYGLYYFPTCSFLFLVCWVFYHERVLNCRKKKFCISWYNQVCVQFLYSVNCLLEGSRAGSSARTRTVAQHVKTMRLPSVQVM